MLNKLIEKFSTPAATPAIPSPGKIEIPVTASAEKCPDCGGYKFWQPIGSNEWRCKQCRPAPSIAFIGAVRIRGEIEKQEEPKSVISECLLSHELPWCLRCNGMLAVERAMSDGTVDVRCWSCKSQMPERVTQNPNAVDAIALLKVRKEPEIAKPKITTEAKVVEVTRKRTR